MYAWHSGKVFPSFAYLDSIDSDVNKHWNTINGITLQSDMHMLDADAFVFISFSSDILIIYYYSLINLFCY